MKGRVVVLGHLRGREVAALFENGTVQDLLVEGGPAAPPAPGTVYRAIVDRPVKGQGGAIVRLPDGAAGFLRQAQGVRPGAPVLAQVTGYAEPGKAVPLSGRVLVKMKYAIATPGAPGLNISRRIRDEEARLRLRAIAEEAGLPEAMGLILRSDAAEADEADVAADVRTVLDLADAIVRDGAAQGDAECLLDGPGAHHLAWREWGHPDAIEEGDEALARHDVDAVIAAALDPVAPLARGATMSVEPTRALVAVDVNTGADLSPAAALKANLAAVRDLPRQLRLRGLGGQVAIDLAPLAKKDRRQLEQALRAALAADPVETAIAGWTPLGHLELQRKRERLPLAEALA